jgi:hypothetical protein
MDPANFEELERTLRTEGPAGAIDRLCTALRRRKDYDNLFHALLMKKRHQLGVSPIPTGPYQEIPTELQGEYEDAIRDACREVGRLFLDQGDIPRAWRYYHMLSEPEPVAEALDRYQPGEGDDCQPLVEIALHYGVHPRKGFDLILDRYGICNAITTAGNLDLSQQPEVRDYCVKRLVRALYAELLDRLRAEVAGREEKAPEGAGLRELLAGRDWLFEEEFAHIDVSHLSSVVQMSIHLSPCEELDKARELCEYGRRLPARFQYAADPPFEDQYRDYGIYLATLAGDNVEEGIAHFRGKLDNADPETASSYPGEVLVNLLLRLDRGKEALAVARRHLADPESRPMSCPSVPELCLRTHDYRALAEVAREQGDPVHFMAGLIAAGK